MEEIMRVLSQGELSRFTRTELFALLRRIAGELPGLKEGSQELRNARQPAEHPQGAGAAGIPATLKAQEGYVCQMPDRSGPVLRLQVRRAHKYSLDAVFHEFHEN
jgi:hypothetical protein